MKFLNCHITNLPSEKERFDTLISPSGTVATLNEIARTHSIDHIGFDSYFPNPKRVLQELRIEIERSLSQNIQPVLLCTTLIYNAEETLRLAEELKTEYHEKLKVVFGGQLVPFALDAYLNNPNIDAVCIGDGEELIPRIKLDVGKNNLQPVYNHWLKDSQYRGKFAFVNYDNFFGIHERLEQQKIITGFSQLCIQGLGGPGCSWAAGNKNGACDFCALQNITEMNTQSMKDQMEVEYMLQSQFAPDRFFDVANQFLPFLHPQSNIKWLREYIKIRKEFSVTTKKYAYLTVASINESIASLLNEAGISEVYLGVDHFDTKALQEENKSHQTQRRLEQTLNALKNNDIKVRMGLVVGSSKETQSSLQSLVDGLVWLKANYDRMITSIGVFPIYVLPGSKVFQKVRLLSEAQGILKQFDANGYFSPEEERKLYEIYTRNHSEVDTELIDETIVTLQSLAGQFTIAYDYNTSPDQSALKHDHK